MSFEWQNLTAASFKGVPCHVAIPSRDAQYGVESEEMTLERRLQFIKRPGIDGAPVRDWGADPEPMTAVIEFFGVNHAKTAETFQRALNEGTPGILILPTLPRAVLAYFWKRTRATHHRDGNAIRMTVTWVAASEVQTAGTGKASAVDLAGTSVDAGKAKLDSDVSNALGVLQDNPLLSAVRSFESGLSKVRSVVNAVLTLEQGVRTRIATLDANVKGTLNLIKGATDEIHAIFSPSASSAIPAAASLGTNSETGQTVTAFNNTGETPAPVDPLAPPAVAPTTSISATNLTTDSGVANFGDAVKKSLAADRDSMAEQSGGRTDDVGRALTAVLNSFTAYIQAVKGEAPTHYEVPVDMSFAEALFYNGIDLSEMRAKQKVNSHVTDPFLVPKGTVLVL